MVCLSFLSALRTNFIRKKLEKKEKIYELGSSVALGKNEKKRIGEKNWYKFKKFGKKGSKLRFFSLCHRLPMSVHI